VKVSGRSRLEIGSLRNIAKTFGEAPRGSERSTARTKLVRAQETRRTANGNKRGSVDKKRGPVAAEAIRILVGFLFALNLERANAAV
jgi:hypothetical protein